MYHLIFESKEGLAAALENIGEHRWSCVINIPNFMEIITQLDTLDRIYDFDGSVEEEEANVFVHTGMVSCEWQNQGEARDRYHVSWLSWLDDFNEPFGNHGDGHEHMAGLIFKLIESDVCTLGLPGQITVHGDMRGPHHLSLTEPSIAGPSTARPLPVGPLIAEPSAAGPSAARPSVARPSAAPPSAAGPSAVSSPQPHRQMPRPVQISPQLSRSRPLPVPMPPALPEPPAALRLIAPSTRMAASASKAKSRAKAKSNSINNPWWCTCRTQWPASGGRQWHQAACPRGIFSEAQKVGTGVLPIIDQTVTCMSCSGPRAGQIWRCTKVSKDGWVRVVQVNT